MLRDQRLLLQGRVVDGQVPDREGQAVVLPLGSVPPGDEVGGVRRRRLATQLQDCTGDVFPIRPEEAGALTAVCRARTTFAATCRT